MLQLTRTLQTVDLTTNRLNSIDPRLLGLTGSGCFAARDPFPVS
jgi:hypothetical protein